MSREQALLELVREQHDKLGSCIDQIGQPDYSLQELVNNLRQVRDKLLEAALTDHAAPQEPLSHIRRVPEAAEPAGAAPASVSPQAPTGDARRLVNAQANDEGLWFVAQTAPESYLQAALRKLHAAVESDQGPTAAGADEGELPEEPPCWYTTDPHGWGNTPVQVVPKSYYDALRACAERLRAAAPRPDAGEGLAWIPASERLPQEPSWNLVCYEGNRMPIGNLSHWFDGERFHDISQWPVTHWMPLPPPPALHESEEKP